MFFYLCHWNSLILTLLHIGWYIWVSLLDKSSAASIGCEEYVEVPSTVALPKLPGLVSKSAPLRFGKSCRKSSVTVISQTMVDVLGRIAESL
jgi:hypothetical protein